jgi:hypothetical protein
VYESHAASMPQNVYKMVNTDQYKFLTIYLTDAEVITAAIQSRTLFKTIKLTATASRSKQL